MDAHESEGQKSREISGSWEDLTDIAEQCDADDNNDDNKRELESQKPSVRLSDSETSSVNHEQKLRVCLSTVDDAEFANNACNMHTGKTGGVTDNPELGSCTEYAQKTNISYSTDSHNFNASNSATDDKKPDEEAQSFQVKDTSIEELPSMASAHTSDGKATDVGLEGTGRIIAADEKDIEDMTCPDSSKGESAKKENKSDVKEQRTHQDGKNSDDTPSYTAVSGSDIHAKEEPSEILKITRENEKLDEVTSFIKECPLYQNLNKSTEIKKKSEGTKLIINEIGEDNANTSDFDDSCTRIDIMAEKNSKGMENITLVNKNYSESVSSFIESDLSDRGRSDIMKERTDHGTVKKNDQNAWSSTGYEHSYTKKSTTTGKNSRGKIVEEDEKHNPTLPCFTDHDLHQNHDTYKRMEEGSELERTQQMIPTSEKSNESEGKEKCKEDFISSTDSHNAATWSERKSGGKAFGFQVDKKDNVGVPSLNFDSSIVNDCAVPEQVTSAANEKEGERVSLEQEIQNDEKCNEEATETCESEPPNEFHTLCETIIVKEGKTEDGSSIVDSSSVDAGEIGQKHILLEINQEHKEGEKTSSSYGVSLSPDTEPSAKFASETYSSEKELKRNWEIKKILADTVTKTTEANSQDLICGTFSGIPNLWTIKDFIVSKFANSSEDEVRRDASGSSSVNEARKQNYESSKQFSLSRAIFRASRRNRDIKTLDDALQYFGLSSRLSDLEKSLEELRRRKKTKEEHERDLKQIDKEMQKLSFRFHPDRVKNRGGSDEEIASAQKLQTALNATRMVLTILNEAFMEDLSADHKYSFYTKLNIGSLANEDKIRNHVYEVLFKIGLISEIKQEKIIAEIRKFLIESKSCIQSYFGDKVNDFEKHSNAAMSHLKYCIKGYKKLRAEFEAVEKECKLEKLDNVHPSIQRMANESLAELTILRKLRKIAKHSLAGSFQIFVPFQHMDDYFVLPLVCYVNVILLCNAVIKSDYQSFEGHIPPCPWGQFDNTVGNQLYFLKYPYHLVLYLSNNIECKRIARRTLVQGNLSGDEAKQQFNDSLHPINVYLEDNFKVSNYAEGSTRGRLIEELKKCMTMMSEFKEKKQELSEDIEKFSRKAEEMDEKYEKIMKKTEELNRKVKERLEQSRKLSEKTSLALSEKI